MLRLRPDILLQFSLPRFVHCLLGSLAGFAVAERRLSALVGADNRRLELHRGT